MLLGQAEIKSSPAGFSLAAIAEDNKNCFCKYIKTKWEPRRISTFIRYDGEHYYQGWRKGWGTQCLFLLLSLIVSSVILRVLRPSRWKSRMEWRVNPPWFRREEFATCYSTWTVTNQWDQIGFTWGWWGGNQWKYSPSPQHSLRDVTLWIRQMYS